MINIEELPGGDLKKRRTVHTLLINELRLSETENKLRLNFTFFDDAKKVVQKGDVESTVLHTTTQRILQVFEAIVHPK